MSAAQPIGPGSIVICTSTQQNDYDANFPLPSGLRLTKEALYCVEAIMPWASQCCVDDCERGLMLKGRTDFVPIGAFIGVVGYCPSQFRPLNDGDTSLVEKEETLDDANGGAGLQTYRVLEPTS